MRRGEQGRQQITRRTQHRLARRMLGVAGINAPGALALRGLCVEDIM
jgi:hypothetical protein